MQTMPRSTDSPDIARPGLFRAFSIVAHLVALLVLVQAVLAGRGQFVDDDFMTMHEMNGSLVWLLALAQPILLFLADIGGPLKRALLGASILMFVLMTAQIGLGYAGRENGEPAALHLPNGVLIFGLSVANISFIARFRREANE
jgi:hypothetical protein